MGQILELPINGVRRAKIAYDSVKRLEAGDLQNVIKYRDAREELDAALEARREAFYGDNPEAGE